MKYEFDLTITKDPTSPISRYDTYVAPWPIEKVSAVDPIWNYVNYVDRAGLWRRFSHVYVPDIQAGDILHTTLSLESTNDEGYAVEWACGLVLTPNETGLAGVENMPSVSGTDTPSGGELMSRIPGYNVTPALAPNGTVWHGMHHGMFSLSTSYIVPEGISGNRYVAAIGYASGSSYTQTGDKLKIEPYCGDMSVTLVRKN
jgi:hypothetical protein